MTSYLADFLCRHQSQCEETVIWANGSLPLQVRSYLCMELPPIDYISTVRSLVFQGQNVMVIRDAQQNTHLTPGGRREPGETLEMTVRREVLEETGWTMQDVALLGFLHFHHLAPKPDGYRYPYPDFVQLVYRAEAGEYREEAREVGGNELEAYFQPIAEVMQLSLATSQLMFLRAAV